MLVSVPLYAGLRAANIRVDTSLAIVGISLTILIFVVQESAFLRPSKRRIYYIGKSTSIFSKNILAGLQDRIKDEIPSDVMAILPTYRHEKEDLAFQIDALQRSEVQNAHALVIVPVADHQPLWEELRRLTAKGVFIVVVDIKSPNRYFL
jgi:hypothetical protein